MRFIHLTDTHLTVPDKLLYGIDPAKRLREAVADINTRFGDAEFVIVTGDLAHRGEPDAYTLLRTILRDLKIPVHLGIGNHDDRAEFCRQFPDTPTDPSGFVQYSVEISDRVFIMLDSMADGGSSGVLGPDRLNWLSDALHTRPHCDTFVFLHHAPVALGIPDLDDIGLRDAAAFGDIVDKARCVKHVFFGHVHRPVSGSWRGIPFSTQRSLVNQSALNFRRDGGILDNLEPPAYSVVDIADSGDIIVHLHEFMDTSPTFYISGLHAIDEHQNPHDVDGTFTQP
jgi:3',5'-cyclic-AMP phosphodiesterase